MTTPASTEQCCPMYPRCTGEFYPPHWCDNEGSWSAGTQDKLDDCRTITELAGTWRRLERVGEVDLIYGAEWHHAVAHLRHKQATGEPS